MEEEAGMFNSLKSKLVVPLVGLLVLMVAFIAVYASNSATNLTNDLTNERIETVSQVARAYVDNLDNLNQVIAIAITGSDTLISAVANWNVGADRPALRTALQQYLTGRKGELMTDAFVVFDEEGTVILRSFDFPHYGDNIRAAAHVAAALGGNTYTLYSSTPVLPMGLTTAAPIWDEGAVIGAISVITNFHTVEFVDHISQAFNAEVTIFAARTRVATTIRTEAGARAVGIDASDHVADMVLGRGLPYTAALDLFGVPFIAYYFPLSGWGGAPIGMFSVAFSVASADAANRAMQRNLLIIGAVSLVVVAFVMLMFIMRMMKPIGLLTTTLDETANGDLTKRLPEVGNDEIARASRSFNKTMEELRKMITAIKQQAGTLSEIGANLASNMTQTASAMNQIAANIQSIKGRVLNQSASVTETNATMEQVTVNINKLSGQVDNQTGAVSQASSAIEEMIANIQSVSATLAKNVENVHALQEASETGKASLQDVASDIQEIVRESEGLLEINAVMENIASQTNLLSMNAAIEAAHAGESGRGFAVVADEIRKLAESSSEQSKTIGDVLKKIKASMDKITRSTDNVLNKFEAIDHGVKTVAEQEEVIRRAMEEQGHGSRQVLGASSQVGDITQQVRGSSIEMLEGSKEVIAESKNLEKATQEITNGINEMAAGAEQVNRAVNTVNDLSGRTQENISMLTRAVSQFKV